MKLGIIFDSCSLIGNNYENGCMRICEIYAHASVFLGDLYYIYGAKVKALVYCKHDCFKKVRGLGLGGYSPWVGF